jgi:predicted AAA+ superfamily ATPase
VVVDEAQNVPAVFDAVQHLYDSDRRRWRFVLCGSSSRKLRATGANLLPGRSLIHHLYPLVLEERPARERGGGRNRSARVLSLGGNAPVEPPFPAVGLAERLLFGELPGIATAPQAQRADLLRAYSFVYLEEELRREALVKDWAAFARFLRLAAAQAGQMINYASISREAGVSLPTVKSHYQLLEDMFVGVRVTAFSGSPRKSLLSTERFLFFDIGVRNAAAEMPLQVAALRASPGPLFEQWVGIELWKRLQYLGSGKLHYLRSKAGAEVDFIVARGTKLVPVEVKWTERPSDHDTRHLRTFLDEHPRQAPEGYVVCRCPAPLALDDRITAVPWWCL